MDPRPLGRQFVAELVLVDVAVDSLMDELPRGRNSSAPNLVDVVSSTPTTAEVLRQTPAASCSFSNQFQFELASKSFRVCSGGLLLLCQSLLSRIFNSN